MIEFTALGIPKAQPRVKACIRGRHAAVYTPNTAKGWRETVSLTAIQHAPIKPLQGPLELTLEFWMPRPKSHYRTGKFAHILKINAPKWHICKPDRDNLSKAVMDAISDTKMIWIDDSQVCDGPVRKLYCEPRLAGVWVWIQSLETSEGDSNG